MANRRKETKGVSRREFLAGAEAVFEKEQLQAFGLADLGYGPEYGYISIEELLENGVELDFHYRPRTVAEQMNDK